MAPAYKSLLLRVPWRLDRVTLENGSTSTIRVMDGTDGASQLTATVLNRYLGHSLALET